MTSAGQVLLGSRYADKCLSICHREGFNSARKGYPKMYEGCSYRNAEYLSREYWYEMFQRERVCKALVSQIILGGNS